MDDESANSQMNNPDTDVIIPSPTWVDGIRTRYQPKRFNRAQQGLKYFKESKRESRPTNSGIPDGPLLIQILIN